MRLALDTNAYRRFTDGDADALEWVREAEQVLMPVPVIAELRYGFLNGTRGRQNDAVLTRFLDVPRVQVLPCDEETASQFAALKLQLKRQGTPIPLNDVWIAALVLQHQAVLYTFDSDFERVPQVPRVEGRYASAPEVVRVREALATGLASGRATPGVFKRLRAKQGRRT